MFNVHVALSKKVSLQVVMQLLLKCSNYNHNYNYKWQGTAFLVGFHHRKCPYVMEEEIHVDAFLGKYI